MIHENPARFFSALPFERCKDCAFCFSPKNDSNTFICVEGMEIRFVGENAFCSKERPIAKGEEDYDGKGIDYKTR